MCVCPAVCQPEYVTDISTVGLLCQSQYQCLLCAIVCSYNVWTTYRSICTCMTRLHLVSQYHQTNADSSSLSVHSLKVGVVHRPQWVEVGSRPNRRQRRFASTSSGMQMSSEPAAHGTPCTCSRQQPALLFSTRLCCTNVCDYTCYMQCM